MQCPPGDIDRLAVLQLMIFPVNGNNSLPAEQIPVLSPIGMSLETQSFSGIDDNPFDLVVQQQIQMYQTDQVLK